MTPHPPLKVRSASRRVGVGPGPDGLRLRVGHAVDERHGGRSPGRLRGRRVRAAGAVPARVGPPAQRLPPSYRGHGRRRVPVYAPALPGFGGTHELDPQTVRSPATAPGSAGSSTRSAWSDVALVAGHSFGGGVATAFVHDQPGAGVLAAAGQRRRRPHLGAVPRRGAHHGPAPGVGLGASTSSSDVIRLARTGPAAPHPARGLRAQPHEQPARHVPYRRVHPSGRPGGRDRGTSPRPACPVDGGLVRPRPLVPRSAFDDLRQAAGVDGVVVEGRHAWLIADPRRFGELAISALVQSGALTAADSVTTPGSRCLLTTASPRRPGGHRGREVARAVA